MSESFLLGIVKIEVVNCADLQPHLMQQAISGANPVVALPSTVINFYGHPSLKWDGSMLNGGRQEKASLEFKTHDVLPQGCASRLSLPSPPAPVI